MAAEKHSSTRRRVLGAAVALPVLALAGLPAPAVIASRAAARQSSGDRERWNRRLDRYNCERAALSARFGSWEKARRSRIGKPLCRAAFTRVSTAEDLYYDCHTAPMLRAMTSLIQTPAPDLPALLAKIEIIREHEPDLFDDAPLHAFEMLREDVGRLAIAARSEGTAL